MATFRFLDRDAAMTLLRLSEEFHQGKRELPPEIVKLQHRIADAQHRAVRFMTVMRVVDWGLVYEFVDLKLQLDTALGEWAESETPQAARSLH